LDTELLVRVCKFMENRETKYDWIFAGLGVASAFLIVLTIIPIVLTHNPRLLIITLLGPMVFIFATGVVFLYKKYDEQYNLAPHFTIEKFDRDHIIKKFGVNLNTDVLERISSKEQNLVVYKGFSPFIGAGIDLGGWSFAINVSQPKAE